MWTNIIDEHRAAEALVDAFTWPGHDMHVGSAEDSQEKREKRRLIQLVERSSGHMYSMCSEERNVACPRRPVEAGDRVFGVAGESLRAGGHVVGVGSPKNEILRSEQKVSYLDHLGAVCKTKMQKRVSAVAL